MAKRVARAKATTVKAQAADDGGVSNDAATAKDAQVAAALDPSPLSPVRKVTSTFVDLLASPGLQSALLKLEPQLRSFKAFQGQSVKQSLALANEGKTLTAVADRLDNSVARIHQRVVRINGNLRAFQTALAACAGNAAEGSDAQVVLAPFALSRAAARGTAKAVKTRNKNARKKPPNGSPTT